MYLKGNDKEEEQYALYPIVHDGRAYARPVKLVDVLHIKCIAGTPENICVNEHEWTSI